ncbi:hypothetical protein TFLX_02215 [Thermoflexales bacterium]|nr:hypothetical protein TFLX_02215 [Thermoflexales bacterium]
MKPITPFTFLVILGLTSCSTFDVGVERSPAPQATSASTVTATRMPSPDPAPTFTATPTETPYAPQPVPPTQVWPLEVARVLPAPLYYLSDVQGSRQIWRVEIDGSKSTMITDLPQPVDAYDISSATGRLAYISNNQLFISDALGHDPQLIDTQNEDLPGWYGGFIAWSPDGTRLAFTGQHSVWLYEVGEKNLRQILAVPAENPFPDVLTLTSRTPWSPDGQTLLVSSLSGDWGEVNYLSLDRSTSLIQIGLSVCDEIRWSLDSRTLYGSRHTLYGPCDTPGLRRWDMLSHSLTPLIESESITPTQHVLARFVQAAQEAPDGALYYFYGSADLLYSDTKGTLFMVRSARDGVTERQALRSDPYTDLYEVLWASDMSAVAVVEGYPAGSFGAWNSSMGTIKFLTTDNKPVLFGSSRPPLVVAGRGCELRWGKAE